MNIGTLTFCTLLCVEGRLQNQILGVQMCPQHQHAFLPTYVFFRALCMFDKRATVSSRKPQQSVCSWVGEEGGNVWQTLEIQHWVVILIVTPLGLWEVPFNIYSVGKNKRANRLWDVYEARAWARPRRCEHNLKTGAIKQITEPVLPLRKIRIYSGFGSMS